MLLQKLLNINYISPIYIINLLHLILSILIKICFEDSKIAEKYYKNLHNDYINTAYPKNNSYIEIYQFKL